VFGGWRLAVAPIVLVLVVVLVLGGAARLIAEKREQLAKLEQDRADAFGLACPFEDDDEYEYDRG
jgi:hypothetical protein